MNHSAEHSRERRWVRLSARVFVAVAAVVTERCCSDDVLSSNHICTLEIVDGEGFPPNVMVVGPHGEDVLPDVRGIAQVPCRWRGGLISLRDPWDRREIQNDVVTWTGGHQRITVPR
jgi:hypothetical protein